jgi:hypothetical protein
MRLYKTFKHFNKTTPGSLPSRMLCQGSSEEYPSPKQGKFVSVVGYTQVM